MKRRGTPEADLQRAVVQALRLILPRTAAIYHCANEVTEPGPRGARRQANLVGMGVHPGFADLMVLCDGRVLFLELKAPRGKLSPAQEAFRDAVLAQGFGWALVRSLYDALGALADHGLTTRVVPQDPVRRAARVRQPAAARPGGKCDEGPRPSDDELAAFYARMVNSDDFLPATMISNTMCDAMLARGLVTPERLRMRGVR